MLLCNLAPACSVASHQIKVELGEAAFSAVVKKTHIDSMSPYTQLAASQAQQQSPTARMDVERHRDLLCLCAFRHPFFLLVFSVICVARLCTWRGCVTQSTKKTLAKSASLCNVWDSNPGLFSWKGYRSCSKDAPRSISEPVLGCVLITSHRECLVMSYFVRNVTVLSPFSTTVPSLGSFNWFHNSCPSTARSTAALQVGTGVL